MGLSQSSLLSGPRLLWVTGCQVCWSWGAGCVCCMSCLFLKCWLSVFCRACCSWGNGCLCSLSHMLFFKCWLSVFCHARCSCSVGCLCSSSCRFFLEVLVVLCHVRCSCSVGCPCSMSCMLFLECWVFCSDIYSVLGVLVVSVLCLFSKYRSERMHTTVVDDCYKQIRKHTPLCFMFWPLTQICGVILNQLLWEILSTYLVVNCGKEAFHVAVFQFSVLSFVKKKYH